MNDRDWMVLEILDQSIRERSGGEMLRYLLQDDIPNREFILRRIGVEGSDLLEQISKNRKVWKNAPLDRPNVAKVPFGKIGSKLLKWLLKSDNLEKDLQTIEIGRFRLLSGEVHQWAYDRYSLERVFATAGFLKSVKCEHGQSRIPEWESYRLEVSESGVIEKPDLLVMEAGKMILGRDDSWKGRKAIITGGCGFIGSNLARRLVEAEAQVTLVDSLVPEYGGTFTTYQISRGKWL
jgi:hypothetical protein